MESLKWNYPDVSLFTIQKVYNTEMWNLLNFHILFGVSVECWTYIEYHNATKKTNIIFHVSDAHWKTTVFGVGSECGDCWLHISHSSQSNGISSGCVFCIWPFHFLLGFVYFQYDQRKSQKCIRYELTWEMEDGTVTSVITWWGFCFEWLTWWNG